ncbi:DUF4919 domain-containing protein [Flavobacterium hungaricum]|uniref:DUF4919 domain-containing protein n=1 Tax=Flavobacterium hungaricum TaxID=2082725 RepID=A0ABR9TNS4_9FLAO|nr:DUF4919 domain-containing protein [Flavobacterium hungaricum]MBE8726709.1 DUF4919 domain-containing protein [Flavobacterium hungaricum]
MFKQIIILLFLFLGNAISAQETSFIAPDYKAIQKEITNKKSSYYYPKLMDRLTKNDTLLTLDEFRHLYFGYFFQPKYNAYWKSPDEEKLIAFYNNDKLSTSDYDQIIQLINHSLSDFPFDLKQLNYLAYVYHLKGDETAAKTASFKFHNIMNVIFSSGDGKQCETGFHVLLVEHEYIMLRFFEIETKSQALTGNCNYFSLEKGRYKIDGIYFNIEKMLENERKSLR